MCCIFTCCGWMIDLIQRAWVFFMSCCISSAVCCVLLTSSMSGVALGYNYSLAEFVDLKETNVSVYLKRGIFDDEIADESDWRRRGGGMPIKGHVRDDDLITGAPEESDFLPERSGRRLEDSILQSDHKHQFEGSLMQLTAKAPYQSTEVTTVTSDLRMAEIVQKFPVGSPDQLKAIQSLINMRKVSAARDPNVKYASTYSYDEKMLVHAPNEPTRDPNYRRQFGIGPDQIPNPQNKNIDRLEAARKAVPDQSIGAASNWYLPKLSPERRNRPDFDYDIRIRPTYPQPVPLDMGPVRPTRLPHLSHPTHTPKLADVVVKEIETVSNKKEPIDVEMDAFKKNLIADKFEVQRPNPAELIKTEEDGWKKSEVDYYDEDIKGLPVRKKRSINTIKANQVSESRDANSKGEKFQIAENSNKASEVTHYPNAFLNKLLSSNKPLSNELSFYSESGENTKIKSLKTNDYLKESTKRVVKMIRSMLS